MGKKALIWIGILLVVIVIVYFLVKKKNATTATAVAAAATTSTDTTVFPLKMGSTGKEVKQLQLNIIKQYDANALPQFGADGKWGSETDAAVKKYLKRSSVSLDYFTKANLGSISV